MSEQIFHFVRKTEAEDWLRLGWLPLNCLEGTGHGDWSILMQWLCDCPMVKPKRTEEQQAA